MNNHPHRATVSHENAAYWLTQNLPEHLEYRHLIRAMAEGKRIETCFRPHHPWTITQSQLFSFDSPVEHYRVESCPNKTVELITLKMRG